MLTSNSLTKFLPAYLKARKVFKAAVKDSKNPHFKSSYVSLEAVNDAITDALLDNGIGVFQPTGIMDGKTVLQTMLMHESGEYIGSEYPVHPVKADPQGEGSALTYARRYALMALVGIAPEDDDGNAAAKAAEREAHKINPTTGVWESLGEDEQAFLEQKATQAIELYAAGDAKGAKDFLETLGLDADEKVAIWTRFDSKMRAAIKKAA